MKSYDFIEIVFKNCDAVILNSDYLNFLSLEDVVTTYSVSIDKDLGKIGLIGSLLVNDLSIGIDFFRLKESGLKSLFGEDSYEKLLKSKDITQIRINFSNERKCFLVYWDKQDVFSNRFQLNKIDRINNKLIIIISISKKNVLK